jgi:DNA (cytosine-5)-methyltransferase 1
MATAHPLNAGDVFFGCGGFSEGFRQAGYNILFGIDWDKWAILTYVANHPGTWGILGDIRKIPIELINALCADQQINVIIGGPPCQGYFNANSHKKPTIHAILSGKSTCAS